MKVGMIDVDGHRYPNLPLMKLSAWHKQQGDSVAWYEPLLHGFPNLPFDRVYMSKVFSFTPDYPYYVNANEVIKGGSGYAIKMVDREEIKGRRWQQLQKETMIKKLVAVKALAERGMGGEKETAIRMYEELKEKYDISEADIAAIKAKSDAAKEKEYSDIMFILWVITNNLEEEKELCRDCICAGDRCFGCGTWKNINELEKQYEELKAQLGSGCVG